MTPEALQAEDDAALHERAKAAHKLLDHDPTIDGLALLAAVVWPERRST